ncbi:hypothetical protein EMIHUDRAFT_256372 [Emiliania huxleyi CCMP1516]|uniref:Secreted protein n=2 Tax=Emiliania huxleyi TaxID=2903 RepID=A0A0D3IWE2_EMIH1|nr:hypothetical protein EMIHUDRAFT_256372 [Emiliania huxleyi CCMP1516]EOD15577.1 hypothetical protein EMIHUDRAFT_256372 [Emiliania huxleyi CCMP1516]|eukprot:XP_005768006.1 hypothetical protein EMIHUDRAFT_256372 [Emiliania huxleyi CCMP1516]
MLRVPLALGAVSRVFFFGRAVWLFRFFSLCAGGPLVLRDRGCEAPLALQLVVVLLLSLCHCVVGPTCAEHAARIVLLAASPTRRSAGTLCARRWQPRRLFSPCQALSASQQQAAAARRQLYCGWPSRNGCSGPKGGQLTPAGNYS